MRVVRQAHGLSPRVKEDKVTALYDTTHGICRACYLERFPDIAVQPEMDLEWQALADSLKGERHGG